MALENGMMIGLARRRVAFNQDIKGLIARPGIDPRFLYYSLWGIEAKLRGLVDEASHGTKRLNTGQLQDLKIWVPDLVQQRRLVQIVQRLDDKVENNRRLAATLEQITASLFKSRFVDLTDRHGLVDSGIGPIPRSWAVGTVSDVCVLEYGKALPARIRQAGDVAVMGSSGLVGSHNERLYRGPGIVVGRKGTAGSVCWVRQDFFPIDTTFAVVGKVGIPLHFLFYALRQANFRQVVADSAVPGLNRDAAYARKVPLPPLSEMEAFEAVAAPCFALRDQLLASVGALETLRDTLLPRLMSGRISVSQAARTMGAAS